MAEKHSILTQERLRELVSYDPETGLFLWAVTRRAGRGRGRVVVVAGEPAGHFHGGYQEITILGKTQKAHRLAWLYMTGDWPRGHIDHINGETMDNRWSNLRDVDRYCNLQNQRTAHVDNFCGKLGVTYSKKRNRYSATMTLRGYRVYIGSFGSAEEAHEAYLVAKRVLHDGATI